MKALTLLASALATYAFAVPTFEKGTTSLDTRNDLQVEVLVGNEHQHVGGVYGDKLRDAIKEALDARCPPGKIGETCNRDEYRIQGILYNAKGFVGLNAHLKIWVEGDYLPYGFHGLREAFINQIADIFATTSQDASSCYDIRLTNDADCVRGTCPTVQTFHWCNAPQVVTVTLSGFPQVSKPQMRVKMNFNGKTLEGPLDCRRTLPLVKDRLDNCSSKCYRAEYEKVMGQGVSTKAVCI